MEITFAAGIACHASIRSADHLGEICVKFGKESPWAKLKVHKTKCKYIIKNVIAKSFKKDIQEELDSRRFSIMVDESTDISTTKLMAIAICYYSRKSKKVINDFIGIIEVVYCTGEILWTKLKELYHYIIIYISTYYLVCIM